MYEHFNNHAESSFSEAIVAKNFVDDGSIKIVTESNNDSDRHMPKSIKLALNDYDRVFWVNILIACEGNEPSDAIEGTRSRTNSVLTNAINDLEAFFEFYTPPMIGDPSMVDHHKIIRSPGYFQHTERLFNPTKTDLENAIERAKDWVNLNQSDPEFKSVQINVCFAGHGGFDQNGDAVVELRDFNLSAINLANRVFSILPSKDVCDNRHRVDLFFDCCHAGAYAFEFLKAAKKINQRSVFEDKAHHFDDGAPIVGIGVGRIFCSSMADEESLEDDLYGHGLFTYAFLNEFSAQNVVQDGMPNLGLKDVGWFSNGVQHPFFISFLKGVNPDQDDFLIKFPSLKYVTKYQPNEMTKPQQISFLEGAVSDDGLILDEAKFFNAMLDMRRMMSMEIETEIFKDQSLADGVIDEDYLQQEIHWF